LRSTAECTCKTRKKCLILEGKACLTRKSQGNHRRSVGSGGEGSHPRGQVPWRTGRGFPGSDRADHGQEEEFGVEISDEDAQQILMVKDAVNFIEKKKQA
jgi:hypothetical protein